ncbi:hypothetical protein BDW71DRAFT_213761 [Aspergillus fruticulosus]
MRQIHGVDGPTHIKHACARCRKIKSRCQGGSSCSECLRRGIHCSLDRQIAAPSAPTGRSGIPPSSAGRSEPGRRFSRSDIESPLLVQAMVVIGLWMSEEPNARSAAIDLHNTLASAISQQRETGDVSAAEAVDGASWPIPTYQGILLHIIFARLGMLYYPNILAQYYQSDPGPYVWFGIEETKRFNLALYRAYRAVSRVGQRATDTDNHIRLTAKDLQFPLPTCTRLWKSVSKAEWDSAAVRGVFDHLLDDTMDETWISRANEALGVDWELDYALQD